VLEICQLARGVGVVVQSAGEWIQAGNMAPLLHPRLPPKTPDSTAISPTSTELLTEDVSGAILKLQATVEASSDPSATKTIYLDAINLLKRTFQTMALNPEQPSMIFFFLVLVDRNFIGLLRARERMALVVLAHYAVMLDEVRECWWSRSWGYHVIKAVYENVGETWRAEIAWAMGKVGLRNEGIEGDGGS